MLTHAFVFAAGYGTRLRPYTLTVPKPMLDVYGWPMVAYGLAGLARAGIRHATVNAAWLAEGFAPLPDLGPRLGLDVALSVQPHPLQHGGDLAFATDFLDRLAIDETFLAANGDTLYDLDGPALQGLAAEPSLARPLVILGDPTPDGPLRVRDGRLVGIGDVTYGPPGGTPSGDAPEERWDDAGLKLFHASVRAYLPAPGTEMSLHGTEGLIGRMIAAGATVGVRQAPVLDRAEVGTVAEYEARDTNEPLRRLADRLVGIGA